MDRFPRLLHLAWDGLVLCHDDPWWRTHYPPNCWGCKCRIYAESERSLARRGKSGPDEAPPVRLVERQIGTRGPSPRTVEVPEGIDQGWDYAPGRTVAERVRREISRRTTTLPPPIGEQLARQAEQIPPPPPPAAVPRTLDEYIEHGRARVDALLERARDEQRTRAAAVPELFQPRLLESLHAERGTRTPALLANRGRGAQMTRAASQRFPDAWTAAADAHGRLFAQYRQGCAFQVTVPTGLRDRRGRYELYGGDGYLQVSHVGNAVHEYAHRLQHALPGLDAFFQELHVRRTANDPLRRLRDLVAHCGYDSREVTREDHFPADSSLRCSNGTGKWSTSRSACSLPILRECAMCCIWNLIRGLARTRHSTSSGTRAPAS